MDSLATIKVDLGINAQRFVGQFMSNNKQLEEVISKGIDRALTELLTEENFEQIIVDNTKSEIMQVMKNAVSDWSVQYKLKEAVGKAVEKKIQLVADDWAEKALKNIG